MILDFMAIIAHPSSAKFPCVQLNQNNAMLNSLQNTPVTGRLIGSFYTAPVSAPEQTHCMLSMQNADTEIDAITKSVEINQEPHSCLQ